MGSIIARIERALGVPGLASLLAEGLAPTDLQSILLEVYRRRAGRRRPADLLADYGANRLVAPSGLPYRSLLEWERAALSRLPPDFECVELSPVCPLGTSSVVAPVSQDWAVSTARNTEVVSDPTNVLALEAALRRRGLLRADGRSRRPVHLAASHRALRPQGYREQSSLPHFRLLALCSAGRDRGGSGFEVGAMALHIGSYLGALGAYLGPSVTLRVSASGFGPIAVEPAAERLFAAVRAGSGEVECAIDRGRTSGRGYYAGLCFHVHARTPSGEDVQLADGGAVDWARSLLSDAKERLVISGIGSERVCSLRADRA